MAVSLCGHSTQREKPSDSELFVCPWDASVIVKAYQNLGAKNERREEEKGGGGAKNAHGFNKTLSGVTLALSPSFTQTPSSATLWHHGSNIQRAPGARLRESRLTSPISYCLSVSLIWSGVGQLPFWTAESRHILAGRLAANKSQPGIYSPFPFIYNISQYCYYEYICIWASPISLGGLSVNNMLLISIPDCLYISFNFKALSLPLWFTRTPPLFLFLFSFSYRHY